MSFFCKNERGLTLFEMVLGIVGIGILTLAATSIFGTWSKSYTTISNRETSHDDMRFAFERMVREIQKIKQGNVGPTVNSTTFQFTDNNNAATSYNYASPNTLYRGTDKLLTNLTSFSFTYYDSSDAATTTASAVRRVKVIATVDPAGGASPLTLRTDIFLRNYLYVNYQ